MGRRFARAPLLLTWVVVLGTCAGHAWAAEFSDPGVCARCHPSQAAHVRADGGHAPLLDCLACHGDRRPGVFGHGHRTIPASCTNHHAVASATHPDPARPLRPAQLRRRCLTCHDPHGSPNAHLIRPSIRRGGRLRPIDFHDAGGAVPGGFVDPTVPGRGLCETCHRDTTFYRADGHGQPHFTDDCTRCHDHAAAFRPAVGDASCAICHSAEAAQLAKPGLHHAQFAERCSACHAQVAPEPGPGHRAVAACGECHAAERVAAHTPSGTLVACTQCHDPHGSDNARLIRELVHTPQGTDRPVHFATVDGRADGSFASVSVPGTGLCETCHSQTQFYRADGSGATHFTDTCIRCHQHARGFAPR